MFKQVIVIRTDLNMGKGKMIAQGAHASVEALLLTQKREPVWADSWLREGAKKIVLRVDSKDALVQLFEEVKRMVPAKLITDAGHTQLEPGTVTCFAAGPAPEPELDKWVGKYKLL